MAKIYLQGQCKVAPICLVASHCLRASILFRHRGPPVDFLLKKQIVVAVYLFFFLGHGRNGTERADVVKLLPEGND